MQDPDAALHTEDVARRLLRTILGDAPALSGALFALRVGLGGPRPKARLHAGL